MVEEWMMSRKKRTGVLRFGEVVVVVAVADAAEAGGGGGFVLVGGSAGSATMRFGEGVSEATSASSGDGGRWTTGANG